MDGTRMRVDLQRGMRPSGDTVRVDVAWSFIVPEYGADRMGRLQTKQGWVYEIAQWYPRMYVYDDVHGWNHMPYLGQGEFYLEYGTFDVEITAPRDMLVVASGELLNPDEVLTPEQVRRYRQARESARTVAILPRTDVGTPAAWPRGVGAAHLEVPHRALPGFLLGRLEGVHLGRAPGGTASSCNPPIPQRGSGRRPTPGGSRRRSTCATPSPTTRRSGSTTPGSRP